MAVKVAACGTSVMLALMLITLRYFFFYPMALYHAFFQAGVFVMLIGEAFSYRIKCLQCHS